MNRFITFILLIVPFSAPLLYKVFLHIEYLICIYLKTSSTCKHIVVEPDLTVNRTEITLVVLMFEVIEKELTSHQ